MHSDMPGTAAYTKATMTQIVMPQFTNVHGTVFGGVVLSWIDICASVSAQRHCRSNVVTASFDEVHFVIPIRHGYVVILESQVNAVFTTSMEIGVLVKAENPENGDIKTAVHALCTFVCLDDKELPKPCPPLITVNEVEKKRQEEAYIRKQQRLMHKKQFSFT